MKGRFFALGFFLSFLLLGKWDSALLLELWRAVRPIFAGAVVAAFLWPPICFLEQRLPFQKEEFRRGGAIALLAAGMVALTGASIWLIIPALKSSIASVWELLSGTAGQYFSLTEALESSRQFLGQGDLGQQLSETASGVVDLLTGTAVAFLLLYRRREIVGIFCRFIDRLWGKQISHWMIPAIKTIVRVFGRFFVGQLTEAAVIGSGCLLFLLLFSFPYGAEISLLVAVTAIIPVAGAIVGTGIGCLVLLSQSLRQALIFLLFMILLQWVENLVIYPKVVGKTIGLSTLGTLTAVIVGGKLFGAAGVLFFVPFMAAVKQFLAAYLLPKSEVSQ